MPEIGELVVVCDPSYQVSSFCHCLLSGLATVGLITIKLTTAMAMAMAHQEKRVLLIHVMYEMPESFSVFSPDPSSISLCIHTRTRHWLGHPGVTQFGTEHIRQ